ncbi:hypothetical protein GA0070606_0583 [Micromonospora citrea]|uniref:Uncharacterized protein n=1 Tax=Micromonospora citrea TaxID=47855 RepID=A0A1C6TTD1_9ACTN|nr:hypothetical protein [Micromonospora citrea]SCL45055.1 hypothetical protein GA0070606_0583 [Micromonospora citrea]
MYVVSRQDELGVLRMVLEEQYERHSTQLALLDRQARRTCADGADVEAASALTAATRRALGDIARALHYLEQGGYGSCERCTGDIPVEELAHRPSARFCTTCQPEPHRQAARGTPVVTPTAPTATPATPTTPTPTTPTPTTPTPTTPTTPTATAATSVAPTAPAATFVAPTASAVALTAPAVAHPAHAVVRTAHTAARAGGAPPEGSWPKAGPPSWRRIHGR